MSLYPYFDQALPYAEFLGKYGSLAHQSRWRQVFEQVALTEVQQKLLRSFTRSTNVLVLAGAWCGDCASQCPAFERFAQAAPCLHVRYLDRDAYPDAQEALKINGGNRVPVAVFFSEDGHEVARYGERTLTRYRQLVKDQVGAGCSTGIVGSGGGELLAGVVQDWLNEFERVQWILRLSPRLRQKHGD